MNRRNFLLAGAALTACGGESSAPRAAEPPVDLLAELSAGRKVRLPAGEFVVRSRLPTGAIDGVGPATRIVMAPECDILMDGTGDASLTNLMLIGNRVGRSYATGMAVNCRGGNIYMDNVTLDDFKASYWVVNTGGRTELYRCTVASRPGNVISGTVLQEIAHAFVQYDGSAVIEDCMFDVPFIKGAAAVFGAGHMTVRRSTILDAGASAEIANEAGAYALLAYPEGGKAPTLIAEDNKILRARSCGIYAAGAKYVEAKRNYFEGINLDDKAWEIPKAAIALNQVLEFYEEGNTFADNAHDIVAAWPTGKYEIRRSNAPAPH